MKILGTNYINSGLYNIRNISFSGKHKDCFGNTYVDKNYTSEFKRINGEIIGYNDTKRYNSDVMDLTRATVGAPVTDETLAKMNINSLKDIGNNCYKGGLTGACEYVGELKDFGIKNFIMLCSPKECNIMEECKKHDMPITRVYMPVKDLETPQQVKYFENNMRISSFIDAVKSLREGHCFVGCESGNLRTKRFLAIVKILDPQCKLELSNIRIYPGDYKCAQLIYDNLYRKAKDFLGYTKEFEAELVRNIKSNLPIKL